MYCRRSFICDSPNRCPQLIVNIRRDLLLYDIRGEAPQQKTNFTF